MKSTAQPTLLASLPVRFIATAQRFATGCAVGLHIVGEYRRARRVGYDQRFAVGRQDDRV